MRAAPRRAMYRSLSPLPPPLPRVRVLYVPHNAFATNAHNSSLVSVTNFSSNGFRQIRTLLRAGRLRRAAIINISRGERLRGARARAGYFKRETAGTRVVSTRRTGAGTVSGAGRAEESWKQRDRFERQLGNGTSESRVGVALSSAIRSRYTRRHLRNGLGSV